MTKGFKIAATVAAVVIAMEIVICDWWSALHRAPETPTKVTTSTEPPLENILAWADSVNGTEDPITVARFKFLLEGTEKRYHTPQRAIANMTITTGKLMRKKGIADTYLSIMEAAYRLGETPTGQVSYAETIAAYASLRIEGNPAEEIITQPE